MPHSPNACRVGGIQLGINVQEATTEKTIESGLVGSLCTNMPRRDHKAVAGHRLLQQEVVQGKVVVQVLVGDVRWTRVHCFQDLHQWSAVELYKTNNKTNLHDTWITHVIKISTLLVQFALVLSHYDLPGQVVVERFALQVGIAQLRSIEVGLRHGEKLRMLFNDGSKTTSRLIAQNDNPHVTSDAAHRSRLSLLTIETPPLPIRLP